MCRNRMITLKWRRKRMFANPEFREEGLSVNHLNRTSENDFVQKDYRLDANSSRFVLKYC